MQRSKSYAFVGILLLLVSLVLFFHPVDWGSQWRNATLSFLRTPLSWAHSLSQIPVSVLQAPALRRERDRLRAQLKAIERESVRTQELALENARLEKLLQLKSEQQRSMKAARVIGREGAPWFRTMLVDIGGRAGVCEGDAVLAEGGLVGQLFDIGTDVSRVMLISDPRFRAAAIVQRSRAQGIVLGSVQGRCYLAYVTSPQAVQVGDTILTSGVGDTIPKGMLIGTVIRVDKDPSGLYYQAQIKPAIDPTLLEEILCLS